MYNIPDRVAREMCFAARARRLNRVLSALYDDRLRSLGISIGQLDMLVTLMMSGEVMRPAELARAMQMERSTVSRNVAKLEQLRLVEVRQGDGKRDKLLFVTQSGERVVAEAEDGWGQAQEEARSLLGHEGVAALETLTSRAARAGGSP
jgi:DNA-binding MarR family transcriptional regulator